MKLEQEYDRKTKYINDMKKELKVLEERPKTNVYLTH